MVGHEVEKNMDTETAVNANRTSPKDLEEVMPKARVKWYATVTRCHDVVYLGQLLGRYYTEEQVGLIADNIEDLKLAEAESLKSLLEESKGDTSLIDKLIQSLRGG